MRCNGNAMELDVKKRLHSSGPHDNSNLIPPVAYTWSTDATM